jgi:hypothetical protein
MLELLIVRLCPNLSTLLFVSSFGSTLPFYERYILSSRQMLPALRTIGLISLRQSFSGSSVGQLLSLAPNLETTHATNMRYESESQYTRDSEALKDWAVYWKGTFFHIQKVAVQQLSIEGLTTLVQSCPQLRDLQYTHNSGLSSH